MNVPPPPPPGGSRDGHQAIYPSVSIGFEDVNKGTGANPGGTPLSRKCYVTRYTTNTRYNIYLVAIQPTNANSCHAP